MADLVKSLKNYTRLDEAQYQSADIHEGIDSSLTLIYNLLKNKIKVVKDYGDLPRI